MNHFTDIALQFMSFTLALREAGITRPLSMTFAPGEVEKLLALAKTELGLAAPERLLNGVQLKDAETDGEDE